MKNKIASIIIALFALTTKNYTFVYRFFLAFPFEVSNFAAEKRKTLANSTNKKAEISSTTINRFDRLVRTYYFCNINYNL